MLAQFDSNPSFPFKYSHTSQIYDFVIRDVIICLYFAEAYILETPWYELNICAITAQYEKRLTDGIGMSTSSTCRKIVISQDLKLESINK